jgi:hypothetical protein
MSIDHEDLVELRHARQHFRRIIIGSIATLSALVVVLGYLNWARGPYSLEFSGDIDVMTTSQREQLVFTADQVLEESGTTVPLVSPQGKATAQVDGRNLIVTFDRPLLFDTEYTVETDVLGKSGREGTLRGAFTTPRATITTLERSGAVEQSGAVSDRIVTRALGDEEGYTVFGAQRIQEFAEVPAGWVVIEATGTVSTQLWFQAKQGGPAVQIEGETEGRSEKLKSSGTSGLVAFNFIPQEGPRQPQLFVTNPLTETKPYAILNREGDAMAATAWMWVPNSTSLVVQDDSQMLWLVDSTNSSPPVALGRHSQLNGFLPGTDALFVSSPTQGSIIDLVSGQTERAVLLDDALENGQNPFITRLLSDRTSYVRVVSTLVDISKNQPFTYDVRRVDGAGVTVLMTSDQDARVFRSLCVSPNEQYFSLVQTEEGSVPDNYLGKPGYTLTSTVIASVSSGAIQQVVPGVFDAWCG